MKTKDLNNSWFHLIVFETLCEDVLYGVLFLMDGDF